MRRRASIFINILTAAGVLAVWLSICFGMTEGEALSTRGLRSLKYFTVLSNLLFGVSCVIYAVFDMRKDTGDMPLWLRVLRLASVCAVFLTFLTVALFLGRIYGYRSMFAGNNLYFHLVIPLLAVIFFLFTDRRDALRTGQCMLCLIPVLMYGAGYILNILVNGRGEWPHSNDFYGFFNWGIPVGTAILACLLAGTLLLAVLLEKLKKILRKEESKDGEEI
jgi:hypothetical protein